MTIDVPFVGENLGSVPLLLDVRAHAVSHQSKLSSIPIFVGSVLVYVVNHRKLAYDVQPLRYRRCATTALPVATPASDRFAHAVVHFFDAFHHFRSRSISVDTNRMTVHTVLYPRSRTINERQNTFRDVT